MNERYRQTSHGERGGASTMALAPSGNNADVALAIAAPRVVVEWVTPLVDGGRWRAKSAVGQPLHVEAIIFCDGHEQLAARLLSYCSGLGKDSPAASAPPALPRTRNQWQKISLQPLPNDRWQATWYPEQTGEHILIVEAWIDEWESYRAGLRKKLAVGADVTLDVEEGIQKLRDLCAPASLHAEGQQELRKEKQKYADRLRDRCEAFAYTDPRAVCTQLLDDATAAFAHALGKRRFLTRVTQTIDVERRAAAFASWYEMFPRAPRRVGASEKEIRHGTFDDVIERLPAIHAMGFDVLYFPPIHPIGATNRKGRNNALTAARDEPGSPYAIGSSDGGHDAIHPQLGDFAAFERLRNAAAALGIELALDFAVQCSPDHPWLREHPEWFRWRPDGSLAYAENPPKKYEDIVNPDFYAEAATPALWLALRDVVLFWIGRGVKIFRVDNPHTKPAPFWQWLIAAVRREHPDVIFLAEAFTRPAMMYRLAKIGFSQSYTYFTWRNSREELTDYLEELTQSAPRDFFRPNFFVNTPDINPEYLQAGGRTAFIIRAALAATLSGLWGMYSGFELCEAEALGREEYLNSEKYELKYRDWNSRNNISDVIARLNQIRRENPALQTHLGVQFFATDNDNVLYFSKIDSASGDLLLSNRLLIAISLDPHRPQQVWLPIPRAALGLADVDEFDVDELMRGQHFRWGSEPHHWYFDPDELPLAILRLRVTQTAIAAAAAPAQAVQHA